MTRGAGAAAVAGFLVATRGADRRTAAARHGCAGVGAWRARATRRRCDDAVGDALVERPAVDAVEFSSTSGPLAAHDAAGPRDVGMW